MGIKEQLRVLVVDDMSVGRGLIIQSLEEIGITKIAHEANGKDALQSMSSKPVHLVISDYNMPEMDGLTLLSEMGKYGITKKTGFILITGTASKDVIDKGKQLGMNNFLRKPFSTAQMKSCISKVFGNL